MKLSAVFPGIRKRRGVQEARTSDLEATSQTQDEGKGVDGKTSVEKPSASDDEIERLAQGNGTPELELRRAIFKSSGSKLARSFDESSNLSKAIPYSAGDLGLRSPRYRTSSAAYSSEVYSPRYKLNELTHNSFKTESLPVLNQRHFSSSSASPSPSQTVEFFESPMVNQEDIVNLTHHVRNFSAALGTLRNTFAESEESGETPEETQAKAHERLGEVLSILKGVLRLYPPLNSVEILSAAGTVIQKIKGHDYRENEEPEYFYQSTDQLAWAFSSSVSDFLMGDQDGGSTPVDFPIGHARSFDNFNPDNDDLGEYEYGPEDQDGYHSDHAGSEASLDKPCEDGKRFSASLDDQDADAQAKASDLSAQKAKELDNILLSMENGIDMALQRTKVWSKYAKDILNYMEKRAHLEVDYCKGLMKLAQTTKSSISEEPLLPLQSTLITALDYDLEYANNCQNNFQNLLNRKIVEPLQTRRTDHDRQRSKLKDLWNKECKKLQDCRMNLKKAKSLYIQKQQELEKFTKQLEAREGKEESSSSTPGFSIGKKKKEEDVAKKAEESEDYYKQCVAEANGRERELERIRAKVLLDLRQLIYQCEMTMKAVTCAYFQMMHSLAAPLPCHFQTLADGGREYEVGARFAEYTRLQKTTAKTLRCLRHTFESYRSGDRDDRLHNRSSSGFTEMSPSGVSPGADGSDANFKDSQYRKERRASVGSIGSDISNHRPPSPSAGGKQPKSAWGQQRGSASDDTDSLTSRSLPASPVGSPTSARRNKDLLSPEPPSDDELLDKDVAMKKFSPGPFRNYKLSAAAGTHMFRKLRSPSRCKECDSYVYFNGAECEQCSITCHKKCLENLAIRCGHKPLPRKMTTFGVDFLKHLQATKRRDIPILVEKCIEEIDRRGLEFKGLYRVSGVKSRVERLCQQFETGAHLVDLSTSPPQVVSSVLKLYLRQLPEPLLTFELYPEFIQIAKDSMSCKFDANEDETNEENDAKCEEILSRLHKAVKKLPHANLYTFERLLRHLKRVTLNSDKNAMNVSSLAIVFGPTLLKPRGRPDSLIALMEMPHQARAIELLIMHPQIVDEDTFDETETDKESRSEATKSNGVHDATVAPKGKQSLSASSEEISVETSIAGQFKEEVLAAWGQGETVAKPEQGANGVQPERGANGVQPTVSDAAVVTQPSPDKKTREIAAVSQPNTVSVIDRTEVTVYKSLPHDVTSPVTAMIQMGSTNVELEDPLSAPTSPAPDSGHGESIGDELEIEPVAPVVIESELPAADEQKVEDVQEKQKQQKEITLKEVREQEEKEKSEPKKKQTEMPKEQGVKPKLRPSVDNVKATMNSQEPRSPVETQHNGQTKTRPAEPVMAKSRPSKQDSEEDLLTFMAQLKMQISFTDDDEPVVVPVSRENSTSNQDIPLSPGADKSATSPVFTSPALKKQFESQVSDFVKHSSGRQEDEDSQRIVRSKTCPESDLKNRNGRDQEQCKEVPRVPPKPIKQTASPPSTEKECRSTSLGNTSSPNNDREKGNRRSSKEALRTGNTMKLVERFSHENLREVKDIVLPRKDSSDADEKLETVVSVKDMKKQFESGRVDRGQDQVTERYHAVMHEVSEV